MSPTGDNDRPDESDGGGLVAGSGGGPGADGQDDMLALLQQIEQEAQAKTAEPPLTVEFGIGDLQELIADVGPGGPEDPLAVLAHAEGDRGSGHPATVHGNLGVGTPESIAAFGMSSQLAVKVVFGEDESGTSSSL